MLFRLGELLKRIEVSVKQSDRDESYSRGFTHMVDFDLLCTLLVCRGADDLLCTLLVCRDADETVVFIKQWSAIVLLYYCTVVCAGVCVCICVCL